MASGMYESSFVSYFGGDLDWVNDAFAVLLIDSSVYSVDFAADENLSDIPEASILAETTMTGRFMDMFALHADSATFRTVEDTGLVGSALVIFKNDHIADNAKLFLYVDNAPEFPVMPDGNDITVNFDVSGVFRLTT